MPKQKPGGVAADLQNGSAACRRATKRFCSPWAGRGQRPLPGGTAPQSAHPPGQRELPPEFGTHTHLLGLGVWSGRGGGSEPRGCACKRRDNTRARRTASSSRAWRCQLCLPPPPQPCSRTGRGRRIAIAAPGAQRQLTWRQGGGGALQLLSCAQRAQQAQQHLAQARLHRGGWWAGRQGGQLMGGTHPHCISQRLQAPNASWRAMPTAVDQRTCVSRVATCASIPAKPCANRPA